MKTVLVNGCMDVLHIAHVRLLKYAKSLGQLTVCINSDSSVERLKGPTRPINNQEVRKEHLESFKFVDRVIVFDEPTAEEVLEREKPQIWVKGGDYDLDSIPVGERMACLRNGTEIVFFDYIKGYSSTRIIELEGLKKNISHF